MSKFSERLIALRKERGETQQDLAKIIHKKRSTVSGYETEGKEPDIETVCLFARHYCVSTDYLLGYTDKRNHVEEVFFNDTVNFKRHFAALPAELQPAVAQCFDHFYQLLNRDIQFARPERLRLYNELFSKLCNLRCEIRKAIEASGGSVSSAVALSDLMALQSQLKNETAALLDSLMQADMEIAFDIKKAESAGSSRKSAI